MNCSICKGNSEDKNTTFMVDLGNCIVIIKNVPSQVCDQCGEISYSHEVSKQIERIVDTMRTAITEIAVVNYTDRVA